MTRLYRLKSEHYLHLLAALLFCALIIGMTLPLIFQLNTHVTPGQQPSMSVPYLGLWTLAWNHHWLKGQVKHYWDANYFYPHQKTLAYSEPQLGIGLLTFPVVFFGGNTVLAYNIALLTFFWGAGMAMYSLCWWLFGLIREIPTSDRSIGAITAGILYAFTPYMFEEIAVIQLLATLFPPLCLLGLHRFFEEKSWSATLLVIFSFLGCWYTCAYYGLFFSVFVICFTILFWHRDLLRNRNILLGMLTVAILVGCLLPLVNGMQSAKVAMSLSWSTETVRGLSAVLPMYFQFPSTSFLYEQVLKLGSTGKSLFCGGMLLYLVVIGIIAIFRQGNFSQNFNNIYSSQHMSDCNTAHLNQQTRFSLRRYGVFYLSMAALAFLLSLGMGYVPIDTKGLGFYQFLVWLSPYNLLYEFVPGFSSIRSPHRFSIFVFLFLSVLAGLGMLWMCLRIRHKWRWILILCLISVIIFELWPTPLRFAKVPTKSEDLPNVYQQVKTLPSEAVLIEFPLATYAFERGIESVSRYMYISTFHWRRLIDGYSSFSPRAHSDLMGVLATTKTKTVWLALKAYGADYVIAHWDNMTQKEKILLRSLEVEKRLIPLFHEENRTLYEINKNLYEKSDIWSPKVESFTVYESKTDPHSVVLRIAYQVNEGRFFLITPWETPIKCKISWYRYHEDSEKNSEPILVKNVSYQQSRLLHENSKIITINTHTPSPGKYRIVVEHRLLSQVTTKTGVCVIHPQGFVQFHQDY